MAFIFGVSQSGRVITHMLWQGFHVDERDRMVFEGARIHVAGGGKGGFNHRFAQTTHHPSHLEGNLFPADHPPFNFLPDGEPPDNDVLAAAKRLGRVPKILITNNALEYWTRSASLIHTDLAGTGDAPIHPGVRIYMTNGAPHGGASSRERTVTEHERNPLGVEAVQRAMLRNLDRWLSDGVEPPPSRVPRLDRGELVTAAEHARRFPAIPGARHPGRNLQPPRLDLGPAFWSEGVFTVVPPEPGEPWPTFVPAVDEDGNGVGGIRLPELAVPLGTYQGFNPRSEEAGAPEFLTRFDGSFWPFAATEAERRRSGDPRPSIEARYPDHQAYVDRVAAAAAELVEERFLLPEDAAAAVELAGRLAWPPEPVDTAPFWLLGGERVEPTTHGPSADVAAGAAVAAASPAVPGTTVDATDVSRATGVQISAEPGLRVYLDGELVGTTSQLEDGLYLADVGRGRHSIRVEKDGFEPQRFDVQVHTRPIEVAVGAFEPLAPAAPSVPAEAATLEVGSLVVTSAPQNCTVEIGGRVRDKTTPQLSIGGLAVGEHTITFSKPGYEPVTSVIAIEAGAESTVHGDLRRKEVQVVHEGLGSLRIFSTPTNCTVWFRDQIHDKFRMQLNLTKIPAGEYPIVFLMPGRKLATSVLIVDGQKTIVEVNFIEGQEPFVIRRVPE
ncbi:MAG TPA: alpha/beta hydrolase domain-containing protein [Candidatus Sulfomarinibacteraceae bacterium]|nr:alpha/beta hydrolase domain-containing protein [Candidatus Sulfomarinibacteraceae bacterium]